METTINGATYRIGKLTVFQQFHIARRLAPVLFSLGAAAANEEGGLQAFEPVADALSKMSDADSEYVLMSCLDVVHRKQGNDWANVRARGGGLMFDDISLGTMVQLTTAVIKENLGNFMDVLPAP